MARSDKARLGGERTLVLSRRATNSGVGMLHQDVCSHAGPFPHQTEKQVLAFDGCMPHAPRVGFREADRFYSFRRIESTTLSLSVPGRG